LCDDSVKVCRISAYAIQSIHNDPPPASTLHGLLQSLGWSESDLLAGLHLDHLADVTMTVGIQATVRSRSICHRRSIEGL
jgi:hypothetical protein